jgi:hypothetical protein
VLAVAIPAAWLVPELIGSGDLLRSGTRARVPNPGQPALAEVPSLAALREAVALPLWPMWIGVAALVALWVRGRTGARSADGPGRRTAGDAARSALLPAAAGAAWIAVVALMAQAGFSGEPRYALPGAALIALSGTVGLTSVASCSHRQHQATLVVLALVALAAAPRLGELRDVRADQAYQWRLAGDLAAAVEAAGGAEAVLACGRPYVGRLRGPLMAYRIGVAKHVVEPDQLPRPPGMVFRSALHPAADPAPAPSPQFAELARTGTWQVLAACGRAPSS